METTDKYYNKLSIIMIVITLIFCILCFELNRQKVYAIISDENIIGYVEDKTSFSDLMSNIKEELNLKFDEIVIEDNFKLKRTSKIPDNFLDSIALQNLIFNNLNAKVCGYKMKIDDVDIAYVDSIEQGSEILNLVAEYYINKNNISHVYNVKLKNKVSYAKIEEDYSRFYNSSIIARDIQEYNDRNSIMSIEILGCVETEEKIPHDVSLISTDKLLIGERKLECKGQDGLKCVKRDILFNNGEILNKKLVGQEILKEPVKEVISVGINNPFIEGYAFLQRPSRGSISSPFGMRNGRLHKGIDIAADIGTPIKAALDGKVTFAGWQDGYGKVIIVKHSGNIETVYAHCNSIEVNVNQKIDTGELIGKVGNTGRSTGPHLHFELRVNGAAVDPIKYLNKSN